MAMPVTVASKQLLKNLPLNLLPLLFSDLLLNTCPLLCKHLLLDALPLDLI
jgi:hypothetical protein